MKNSYISINKNLIPYTFEIVLGNDVFEIGVNYNYTADLFTLSLFKDGEEICANEPVIYGVPLWNDVYRRGKYPILTIIPLDESGEADAVTWDNFEETVFLFIDDTETSLIEESEETETAIAPRGTIKAITRVQEMQDLKNQIIDMQRRLDEANNIINALTGSAGEDLTWIYKLLVNI